MVYFALFTSHSLSEKINKINVIGNERISEETILMFSSVSINDDLDNKILNDVIINLYETEFFQDVSVKFKNNTLEIFVVENPLIENIEYTGLKSEKLKSNITKNLKLKSRSSYNELTLKKDKDLILTNLKNLGYHFSTVDVYVKNLNTVAKNDKKYKSSPSTEIANIYNFTSSLPLIKESNDFNEYLEPKLSFRINPGDMIDNSANKRLINTDNVFDINRLGLSDTFEAGKSLTIGIDYKKESTQENVIKNDIQTENINDYFEIKLAKVFKDKNEDLIPVSSTLDKKSSNLFGSIKKQYQAKSESALIDLFSLGYYFSLDNNLNTLNYNSLNSELNIGNFKSELNFIKESGVIGNASSIQNTFSYNLDDANFFSFNTRRNRKINLTEYYDFVYEYKNDCLTAGIKYKKTYYQDRDVKPTEDIMLTFTFFPLTTYEQEIDQNLYRN